MALTIREIDERVEAIDPHFHYASIFDLLGAYGIPKSTITRLQKNTGGTLNKGRHDDELVWKDKVFFSFATGASKDDLLGLVSEIENIVSLQKVTPRFLIAASEVHVLAKDTKTGDSLDIKTSELKNNASFFAPWAKIERSQIENTNPADVKAAAKMANLYDEIVDKNDVNTSEEIHALNVFFARLLFCFFAEDTGVFGKPEDHLFSNTIVSRSQTDGSDFAQVLDELFIVLDTPMDQRDDIPTHFAKFGYVNGSLFSERTSTPTFTAKSRAIVMECAELDWSQINPDIFGSMIQAVVHPSQRSGLGMHYTSVENIMKVLRPLFIDELQEAFEVAENDAKKLTKLLDRIASIKVFDPACGSGNFLIIAYKELRHLEHQILERIHQLSEGSLSAGMAQTLFPDPRVKLENFYGIEIDDFACEIATLSLWLAKHQMNLEFAHMFDKNLSLIPLVDHGNIVEGNATRIDWQSICPVSGLDEVFICGNPPYLGSSGQTNEQKSDLDAAFSPEPFDRGLDYVSAWFIKGARMARDVGAKVGFVATNSLSQGSHVGMLWPIIFKEGVELSFVHTSFKWENAAKGNAGVTVAIYGFARVGSVPAKRIFHGNAVQNVVGISPYLTAESQGVVVQEVGTPISDLPPMLRGSSPTDDGELLFSPAELDQLLSELPTGRSFVRRYFSGQDFLNGKVRYCLWLSEQDLQAVSSSTMISRRLMKVSEFRRRSKKRQTRECADRPFQFQENRHVEAAAVVVPRISSERREYVPVGYLTPGDVIADTLSAVYGADSWVLGLIQSRMHNVWIRSVAGRLKTDIRYSPRICYNTFPVPPLTKKQNDELTRGAVGILSTREKLSGRTLAELYDPVKMPIDLREAHKELDEIVDKIYQPRSPFASDEARLERLFMMYAKATGKASEETLEQLALLDE